ncbi:aminotransferase class IV [Marinithermus hydrothermalis DSM 14884]|uniref:Aminotransferase class IV n=1 Tax=Marinithermus hydrothermalis (strain DSM 14884 / JCM 11576 / T1) TaxID=869210 RepID=F2NLB1_MARHT|nr:aminotransferase class IV [Marinithermus hydrothermalis DSM 14884]
MRLVIVNGEPAAAAWPVAFVYHGASVFTTLRSEGGEPLWWGRHLDRLRRHAEALGLPYPGHAAFERAWELLRVQGPDLRVRLTVGEGVWCAEASPYRPLEPGVYLEGVRVHVSRWRVHPDLARYKTGNYLPYRLALAEARAAGAFEALLLDGEGCVVDGSRTSPLLYRDGVLTVFEGGLEGITREVVAEAAREMGLGVRRARLAPGALAGQLLLAGSGVGLVPVGAVRDAEVRALVERFRPGGGPR